MDKQPFQVQPLATKKNGYRQERLSKAWFWIWPCLLAGMIGVMSVYAVFTAFVQKRLY